MWDMETKVANSGATDAGKHKASEYNNQRLELEKAASHTGITLTTKPADPDATPDTNTEMLAESMSRSASMGTYGVCTGTANTYVVTAITGVIEPKALFTGMRVSTWINVTNTGATTANVFGLGSKKVLSYAGTALAGDELAADYPTVWEYDETADSSNGAWLLLPWANASSSTPIPKRIRVIDTSGTYTPTDTSVIAWDVILQAPGGGGGGVDGQGAGTVASATGGQGGGRSRKFILIADPATYSADFVIPAGGAGGAAGNNNGADASDITFDDGTITFDAPGGTGGEGDIGTSGASARAADDAIIGTTGDENYPTTRAGDANYFSGNYASRSAGGPSLYGTANRPASNTTPSNSTGYGAGGTGANARATIGNYAGAAGADGVAFIREYTR